MSAPAEAEARVTASATDFVATQALQSSSDMGRPALRKKRLFTCGAP